MEKSGFQPLLLRCNKSTCVCSVIFFYLVCVTSKKKQNSERPLSELTGQKSDKKQTYDIFHIKVHHCLSKFVYIIVRTNPHVFVPSFFFKIGRKQNQIFLKLLYLQLFHIFENTFFLSNK
jgi:hypothetical protein